MLFSKGGRVKQQGRLSHWARQSLMGIISWSMIFSQGASLSSALAADWDQPATDQVSWAPETEGDLRISYDEKDATLSYGQYGEVEFTLEGSQTGQVEWTATAEDLPPGMEFEQTSAPRVLLFGTPRFQDKWCFALSAKVDGQEQKVLSEEVCLFAALPDATNIPGINPDRYLEKAIVSEYYQTKIELDATRPLIAPYELSFFQGALPEGLELTAGDSQVELQIQGTAEKENITTFVVVASVPGQELSAGEQANPPVYKQFQLEAGLRADEGNGNGDDEWDDYKDYLCAPGYYYDPTLGFCVQNRGPVCGDGTYYDPQDNQCKSYRSDYTWCPAGTYYDQFLYRCVRIGAPRCPYNYRYDSWSNRCERESYSCSYGQRYNWNTRSCEWIGYACGYGYHYDYSDNRCEPNRRYCPAGYHADSDQDSCERTRRYCGGGSYWDPYLGRCTVRRGYCPAGYTWDYQQNRCERHVQPRTCSYGTHWSEAYDRCIPNRDHDDDDRPRACPTGYRWSTAQRLCVRVAAPAPVCGPGQVYSPAQNRCINRNVGANCPAGTRWDVRDQRCESTTVHNPGGVRICPNGQYWDNAANRCRILDDGNIGHNCPIGSRWDANARRCVNPQPHPIPHKPVPGPAPVPPHKPTPIPHPQPVPQPHKPDPAPAPHKPGDKPKKPNH